MHQNDAAQQHFFTFHPGSSEGGNELTISFDVDFRVKFMSQKCNIFSIRNNVLHKINNAYTFFLLRLI
jgi:hypothetical protein